MTMQSTIGQSTGPLDRIGIWILKRLVALAFLGAAALKLSGSPKMARCVPGAVILTGICGGALIAELAVLHHDVIHVIVLGGLVLLIGWLNLPARLSGRRP